MQFSSKSSVFLLVLILLNSMFLLPTAAQSGDCLQTQFSADDYYPMAIVTPGDSNNVRAEPSPSGELLGQIPAGSGMQTYRDDPVCLNGNLWRHIAVFLRKLRFSMNGPNCLGDTITSRGWVVAKREEAGTKLLDLEIHLDNEVERDATVAHLTIELPA